MKIEDYEKVYDLWIHTEGMGLNTTDDSREGIAKYLLRNPNTCFVAEENGELVGVIMSGHDGRRGFIYHTTVKAEYRNRGIGKKLVLLLERIQYIEIKIYMNWNKQFIKKSICAY